MPKYVGQIEVDGLSPPAIVLGGSKTGVKNLQSVGAAVVDGKVMRKLYRIRSYERI